MDAVYTSYLTRGWHSTSQSWKLLNPIDAGKPQFRSLPLMSSGPAYNCSAAIRSLGVILNSCTTDYGQSRCCRKQILLLALPRFAPYAKVSARWRRKESNMQHRRFSPWLLQLTLYWDVRDKLCQTTASTEHSCMRRDMPQEQWSYSTPVLADLHWLPIRSRMTFQIALLTYSIRKSGQQAHLGTLEFRFQADAWPAIVFTGPHCNEGLEECWRGDNLFVRRCIELEQSTTHNQTTWFCCHFLKVLTCILIYWKSKRLPFIDHCNALLFDAAKKNISKLKRAQDSRARLVTSK